MNLKRMYSKYHSRCKRCRANIRVGDPILWSRDTGALCMRCGENDPGKSPEPSSTPSAAQSPKTPSNYKKPAPLSDQERFSVDWPELKAVVKAAMSGEFPKHLRAGNISTLKHYTQDMPEYFTGYTKGQLERWMAEGYQSETIQGLKEFIPPIREKRRLQFTDEGDEFHLDLAYNGDDNYMSEWTKREAIPGLRVDFIVAFQSTTSPEIVNAFNRWCCKSIYSLEAAGVDCEVNYVADGSTGHCWDNRSGRVPSRHSTVIRLKKEGEITDFVSISPMLSPAAYRTFGFAAVVLHGDAASCTVNRGIGTKSAEYRDWDCFYDPEAQLIRVTVPYTPSSFPEEKMTAKLRDLLKGITKTN